jgi:hypothetical protein
MTLTYALTGGGHSANAFVPGSSQTEVIQHFTSVPRTKRNTARTYIRHLRTICRAGGEGAGHAVPRLWAVGPRH